MDFIFMLTRQDQTVQDCLEVVDAIEPLGLGHVGFKDVGVEPELLRRLAERIKGLGATSYLEVVSTDEEAALNSARMAVELGVDCLLGGTWVEPTMAVLAGSDVEYLPFVGRPEGHPTRLGGDADLVAAQCREASARGCAGVDLLAYRAFEADPLELVAAARDALDGRLVVAGSVVRAEQMADLKAAGVDAFTIGTAAFAGELDPGAGLLTGQLRMVDKMLAAA